MMLKRMFRNGLVFGIAAFCLAVSAQAGNLNLSKGTKSAGGWANFTLQKAAGAGFDTMDYGFDSRVFVSYFVADHWEVLTYLGMGMSFNRLTAPNTRKFTFDRANFGVGTSYYFDLDSIFYPYLGLNLVVEADNTNNPTVWYMALSPRFGTLIALNCEVALDVGLGVDVKWQLTDINPNKLASAEPSLGAVAGYFGARVFF